MLNKNLLRQLSSTAAAQTPIMRPIAIQVGSNGLYKKLQRESPHLYRRAPLEGVRIVTSYADTSQPETDSTIVALHGVPGTHDHYRILFSHYSGTRVRVIVPNFPTFDHTRESGGLYWHTVPESVDFLKQFLKQIEISEVDCLVAHSSGFHPAAGLFEDVSVQSIEISSIFAFHLARRCEDQVASTLCSPANVLH